MEVKMGERKYTKLDENNVAVIEMNESRTILNKETLLNQKKEVTDKFNADVKILDEALAQFTTSK